MDITNGTTTLKRLLNDSDVNNVVRKNRRKSKIVNIYLHNKDYNEDHDDEDDEDETDFYNQQQDPLISYNNNNDQIEYENEEIQSPPPSPSQSPSQQPPSNINNEYENKLNRIEINQNLIMLKLDTILDNIKYLNDNCLMKTQFNIFLRKLFDQSENLTKSLFNQINANNNQNSSIVNQEDDDDDDERQYVSSNSNENILKIECNDEEDDYNTQNSMNSSSYSANNQNNQNNNNTSSLIFDEHAYYNPLMNQFDTCGLLNGSSMHNMNNIKESYNVNGENTIKYELPNIETFDTLNINTEEISLKLRELLTNYDISRELFGEAILNSSRKVTNQILTNPKTFKTHTKLYQLRFLKVKMWLDDENKIEKIRNWKINNSLKKLRDIRAMKNSRTPVLNLSTLPQQATSSSIATGSSQSPKLNIEENYEEIRKLDIENVTTEEVANELKEVLLKYKISQRLFGQAVLNVHKNVISLLLLEPKTWATLSRQARERYLQIYTWLNDPKRFQKISEFLELQSKLPKNLRKTLDSHT